MNTRFELQTSLPSETAAFRSVFRARLKNLQKRLNLSLSVHGFEAHKAYYLKFYNPTDCVRALTSALLAEAVPILVPPRFDTIPDGVSPASSVSSRAHPWTIGVFSSGSTSKEKLYFLDIYRACLNAESHLNSISTHRPLQIVQVLPIYHAFGLVCIYLPAVLFESIRVSFSFSPFSWLNAEPSESDEVLLFNLTPDHLSVVNQMRTPSSNFVLTIGAGEASKINLDDLYKTGVRIFTTYGLTEAGPRVTTGEWNLTRPQGWVGFPIPGVSAKIEKDGTYLLEGEGELLICTPYASLGADPNLQSQWIRTGDIFRLGAEGLTYISRKNPSLILNGQDITLHDLKMQLISETLNGRVVFASTMSDPHATKAFVHCALEHQPHWSSALERLGVDLSDLRFVDEIPMNEMGKFQNSIAKQKWRLSVEWSLLYISI